MKKYDNTKDDFSLLFEMSQHIPFLEYLEELELDTHWKYVNAKSVHFVPLNTVREDELTAGMGDAYKDALHSVLPICAVLDSGEKYLVRPYLLKNIKHHHRDNAAILTDMLNHGDIEHFCDHISMGRKYLRKKLMMLLRGDKISGWFSEFNANWSQKAQVQFFEEKMLAKFPHLKFNGAEVNHHFTKVEYILDDSLTTRSLYDSLEIDDSVMSAYAEAWNEAGVEGNIETAIPICTFTTGESGLTAIEVRPLIRLSSGHELPLGSSLSVNHRGNDKAVWEKFETFPDQVAVLFKSGMDSLEKLCNRSIRYPYCCVTHALTPFRASVPTEMLKMCACDAEIMYPRDLTPEYSVYAITLFNDINYCITQANKNLRPVVRLRNIEMLGRLLQADWKAYDQNRISKYFTEREEKIGSVASDDVFGL